MLLWYLLVAAQAQSCQTVFSGNTYKYFSGLSDTYNITLSGLVWSVALCQDVENTMCPPQVAVCVVNTTSQKWWSFGDTPTMSSSQDSSNGGLTITYSGPGFGKTRVSTTINVVCTPGSTSTALTLVHTDQKTQWQFQMNHQDACPTSTCSITDGSGNLWDVSGLEDRTFNFTAEERIGNQNVTMEVSLAICSRAQHTRCDPNSAVCFAVPSVGDVLSGGSVFHASFSTGPHGVASQLTYSGGNLCPTGSTTVINFICNLAAGVGMPVYTGYDVSHCVSSFSWATAFACQMNYIVHLSGYLYDLQLATGTYNAINLVTNDPDSYAVSLCGPAKGNCQNNPGVCEIDTLFDRPESAGSWDHRSYEIAPGTSDIVVTYTNGAPSDVNIPLSSVIHLFCNNSVVAAVGTPYHVKYDAVRSIHYFNWTSLAGCPVQVFSVTPTPSVTPSNSLSRSRSPSQTPSNSPSVSFTASPSASWLPATPGPPSACGLFCGVAIGLGVGLGLLLAVTIYIAIVLYRRVQRLQSAARGDAEARKSLIPNTASGSTVN